jgi:hypothetical protein
MYFVRIKKGVIFMIEYMLHWWGGCEEKVKEKYGYDNYLYFTSKKDKYEVKDQIMAYHHLGVAFDEKEGELTHKDTIALVTLKYKGKTYFYEDNFGKEYDAKYAIFQYKENNYSCDCNRSLFIQRYCDETFPELECGDEIKLVNLEIIYR